MIAKDIQKMNECPDCASLNIVHNLDREQLICRECGLIYEPLTTEVARATPRKTVKAKKTVKRRK